MGVRIIAYVSTLMQYAHELGQARLSGDAEQIAAAQAKQDEYRDLCLRTDVDLVLTAKTDDRSSSRG